MSRGSRRGKATATISVALLMLGSSLELGLGLFSGVVVGASPPVASTHSSGASGAGRPELWFSPLPAMPLQAGRDYVGSDDFMELFDNNAPWNASASVITVFKLYGDWVEYFATDGQLSQVVSNLKMRGIALAVEAGPLTATAACGRGVESFNPVNGTMKILGRIAKAGGNVTYIAMDEPFYFAHYYQGENACKWSVDKVASELHSYANNVRSKYPWIRIGDIEPLVQGIDVGTYESWLDAYREASGSYFAFFHADVGWARADWPVSVAQLETYSHGKGMTFGMIYDGVGFDGSDSEWISQTESRMTTLESEHDTVPDQAVIQSWSDHPDHNLPESDNLTLTHLVLWYSRGRTLLDVQAWKVAGNSTLVAGTLKDSSGAGVASAAISVYADPTDGPEVTTRFSLEGVVPAGAVVGNFGIRVNTECGCAGRASFHLAVVEYSEGDGASNLIQNPRFASGLQGWGSWGNGTLRLEQHGEGGGNSLHATAEHNQSIGLNSAPFSVTPGEKFVLGFNASVSPSTREAGVFSVIFSSGRGEVRRVARPMTPQVFYAGTALTDSGGRFMLGTGKVSAISHIRVEGTFAGNRVLRSSISWSTPVSPGTESTIGVDCGNGKVFFGMKSNCVASMPRGAQTPALWTQWGGGKVAIQAKCTSSAAQCNAGITGTGLGQVILGVVSSRGVGSVQVTVSAVDVQCRGMSVVVGKSVVCRAVVYGRSPTGSIAWSVIGSGALSKAACRLIGGACSISVIPASAGSALFVLANYTGDSKVPASGSSFALGVTPAHSKTQVVCKENRLSADRLVANCDVKVLGYSPTGVVRFTQIGGTAEASFSVHYCTLASGICAFSFEVHKPGTVTVTVSYPGDVNNSESSIKRTIRM